MGRSYGDVRPQLGFKVISLTGHLSADPELTQLGEQQAQDARSAWETERRIGVPIPERLYTSPLTRAIRTNQITFDDTMVSGLERTIVEVSLFIPCTYVLDALVLTRRCRPFANSTVFIPATSGAHAQRSTMRFRNIHSRRTLLRPMYSGKRIIARRTLISTVARQVFWISYFKMTVNNVGWFLCDSFPRHCKLMALAVISITTHGGFIGGFLRVCHHHPWFLPTGGE